MFIDTFTTPFWNVIENDFSVIKNQKNWSIMRVTTEVQENKNLLAKFYVPGFEKEEIKVKSKDNDLIIIVKDEKKIYSVADVYDVTKLTAKLKNGILEISIPQKVDTSEIEISIM